MDSCLCGAFPVCWALTVVTFTHSHSDGRPLTDWGENWCRGSLSGHSRVWSQDLRWRPQLAHQEQFLIEYLVRWYFNMQPGHPGIKSLIPISWRDAHSCSCVINTYWILRAWLLSPLTAGKWCFILFIFLLVCSCNCPNYSAHIIFASRLAVLTVDRLAAGALHKKSDFQFTIWQHVINSKVDVACVDFQIKRVRTNPNPPTICFALSSVHSAGF